MLRAVSPTAVARLLASSAAAGMSVTGTTNETALATVLIPAGAMGTNGGLHIYTTWTVTNNANSKTIRVRFGGIGGTGYLATTVTASATIPDLRRITNRGVANSQVGGNAAGSGMAASTNPLITSSVDTSAAVDVVITGTLANAADTVTLESYEVWLLP